MDLTFTCVNIFTWGEDERERYRGLVVGGKKINGKSGKFLSKNHSMSDYVSVRVWRDCVGGKRDYSKMLIFFFAT